MASTDTRASFNHSCVKTPLDPISKMPCPGYERRTIPGIATLPARTSCRTSRASSASGPRSRVSSALNRPSSSTGKRTPCLNSKQEESVTASLGPLLSFYESIPDYSELNHLPDREFYAKVRELRETQRAHVTQLSKPATPDPQRWTAGVQGVRCILNESRGNTPVPCSPSSSARSALQAWGGNSCTPSPLPCRRTSPAVKNNQRNNRPSSGTSQGPRVSSARRSRMSSIWDDDENWDDALLLLSEDEADVRGSSSRMHKNVAWQDPQFTLPKPFSMTRREEEDRYYALLRRELLKGTEYQGARTPSPPPRSHDVPITSRIPLFHGILLQQELRREREKRRSKARLLSQVRPFSFDLGRESPTMRLARMRCKLWQSSPELRELSRVRGGGTDLQFRAKPMPRHLYSTETLIRHQEDEFLRSLQRRVRAEEMLRDSSLPPSMAARTVLPHPPCSGSPQNKPRRQHSAPISKSSGGSRRISRGVSPEYRTDGCSPYEVGFRDEPPRRARRHSGSVSPIRHNLAAVLRIENCRRRAEREAALRLEERRGLEEARARARVLRRRPAWRHMQQMSARRDLAVRTEARREEELSRQHEHSRFMGRMMGRVLGIPTLFERQAMQSARLRRNIDVKQSHFENRASICRSPVRKFATPPTETHISFCPGTRSGDTSVGSTEDEKHDEPEFTDKKDTEKCEEIIEEIEEEKSDKETPSTGRVS